MSLSAGSLCVKSLLNGTSKFCVTKSVTVYLTGGFNIECSGNCMICLCTEFHISSFIV